ncbi:hypothetical protein [Enterococcus hirae]|uniref:hypothetical protein n=1 Tax=Enterococcus hirae TaxID=1354 RepID=UPI001378943E|nr:hypothetical protein [Enterococcus hirae]NBA40645.1 hypothetical protein [Enterococcus hirae]NBA56623.1 hypothetical protein [Enterococcus hirae]
MEKIKKKRSVLLILLLFVVIGGIVGYFFFRDSPVSDLFDSNAKDYQSNIKKPEDWPKSKIAFPAYGDMQIEEGTDKLYIALVNPDFNEANLQYILYLNGENKSDEFYETGLISPGKAVTEVSLPRKLAKGEYTIYLHTKAFAPKDPDTKLNSVQTSFKLTVLEKGDKK